MCLASQRVRSEASVEAGGTLTPEMSESGKACAGKLKNRESARLPGVICRIKGKYWADPSRFDLGFLEKAGTRLSEVEKIAQLALKQI